MKDKNINFIYFGTGTFGAKVLETIIENGFKPAMVITSPDKPAGRKMTITPPPVKVIAQKYNLRIEQPEKLTPELLVAKPSYRELFIVADYGKIILKNILEIPKHGTLNVHPSLLPKYKGSSPIQSFILSGEKETGVTIMLLDEEVDHGPIVSISKIKSQISNLNAKKLEEKLAELGGQMLADILPKWISEEIKAQAQDHTKATFTKKLSKEDGLVDLEKDSPEAICRKFLAFNPWPGIYYFTEKKGKKIRVIITDMELSDDGELTIKKIKPEGKKEMDYKEFLK